MQARRFGLVLLTLTLTASLAGCNVRDWWDLRGDFHVEVRPLSSSQSAIGDFQKLTLAIQEVSLKQEGELNAHLFGYGDEPLLVDMVELGEKGLALPVVETNRIIRPMTSVTVRLYVVEAIDAQGRSLPACFPGQPVESRPCVSTPINGAYTLDTVPFSPPRGGSVTFSFPLAVQYSASAREYYIQADDALIQVTTDR